MIQIVIFTIVGYLFFKYLLPLLKNNNSDNQPKELLNYYTKHPKLLVFTVMLSLLGTLALFEMIMSFIGFIFVSCPTHDLGTIGMMCWIKIHILGINGN